VALDLRHMEEGPKTDLGGKGLEKSLNEMFSKVLLRKVNGGGGKVKGRGKKERMWAAL